PGGMAGMSGMGQHGMGAGAIPTTPPSRAQAGPMGSVTGRGNAPAPALLANAPGTAQRLAARGGRDGGGHGARGRGGRGARRTRPEGGQWSAPAIWRRAAAEQGGTAAI